MSVQPPPTRRDEPSEHTRSGSATAAGERPGRGRRGNGERSVGELMAQVTTDATSLLRQEVELAKAEVREEAARAGKAAGMFGGAGFGGYMVALFGSLAAVFGLANLIDWGWAALVVTGAWALIALVLALVGRAKMRAFSPKPQRTLKTLKEDATWARHPTG